MQDPSMNDIPSYIDMNIIVEELANRQTKVLFYNFHKLNQENKTHFAIFVRVFDDNGWTSVIVSEDKDDLLIEYNTDLGGRLKKINQFES